MAVTPIFICGAECACNFAGTSSPAVEHWNLPGTAPTISTTTVNSAQGGVRSFRCQGSASTGGVLNHAFAAAVASPATTVGRFYVYFATLPNADTWLLEISGTARVGSVQFESSDNSIRAGGATLSTTAASGVVVTTGQWYRVDFKVVFNTTITVDVQVNGTAATQYTVAGGADSATNVQIGCYSSGNFTGDAFIDDLIVSGTSGDFPIGAGGVAGLYPSGDGAHSYSATTDFLDGGTAQAALAASGSEVDTWLSLRSKADGGLSSTVDNSNFVTNATGATTEYLRWNFENLPSGATSVNGVASVSTHHAASTTGNTQAMKIIDVSSGTDPEITVLGTFSGSPANTAATGVDLSDTTIICVYKCAATGETTGAWTVANVNDLGVHWSSTDVTPDAYIDGICLECSVTITDADVGQPHVIIAPSQAAQTASRW